MIKNYKLKFSEYMQNTSRSKSFGRFFLIVYILDVASNRKTLIDECFCPTFAFLLLNYLCVYAT